MELVSTFIELINIKMLVLSIGIIGVIYIHPNQFNDIYLNPLLDKISKESKSIFPLGDFNMVY